MSKGAMTLSKLRAGASSRDVEKQTNDFIRYLTSRGVPKNAYTISRSVTDFGMSNYVKFHASLENDLRPLDIVRISDHSVGQRRLFDEIQYRVLVQDKPAMDRLIQVVLSWQ